MVKFVHTADWQLGKTFGQFNEGLSETLRQARLDAIEKIGNIAKDNDAKHILVAGDIYDQELASQKTIQQSLDIMSGFEDVKWWLLPGNHDPHRQAGLWSRMIETGLPDDVIPLIEAKPYEIESGTFLLPAPWRSKNPGVDNTEWMDSAETNENTIRIGIAHGSVVDFGEGQSAQNCVIKAFERNEKAKLDYLALGDWHGKQEFNERIWYSGTPETDSFKNNQPGWALVVEIEKKGKIPLVTPVRTTAFHWINENLELVPGSNIRDIFENILDKEIQRRKSLAKLSISGTVKATLAMEIKKFLETAGPSFASFSCNFENLQVTYSEDDLDNLDLSGSLRQTADVLIEQKNNPEYSNIDRKDAERALELLISFAAGVSG